MTSCHVTDDAMQAYILQEMSDYELSSHISKCAVCESRLEAYRILMSEMAGIEPEVFSFDVSSFVLQKIEQHESRRATVANFMFMVVSGLSLFVFTAISWPWFKPGFQIFSVIPASTSLFILVSAMSVLIFMLTDIARQYRQKELLLLK